MTPGQEAFIGIAKIGFVLLDNASQRLEYLALGSHSALYFRLPRQPHVFEHRDADAFETASAQRVSKLATGLLNRDRRVMVEAGQYAQEKGTVGNIAGDRSRNR